MTDALFDPGEEVSSPAPSAQSSSAVSTSQISVATIIGAVTFAVVVLGEPTLPLWWFALDLATGAALLVVLNWRRAGLVPVAMSACVATAWSSVSFGIAIVLLVLVGRRRRWQEVLPAGLLFVAAVFVNDLLLPGTTTLNWWSALVLPLLLAASCLSIGAYLGSRRDLIVALRARAVDAEREASVRVEHAKAAERARIAREMHDVVAHRISSVALLSGALVLRPQLDASQRQGSIELIRDNAETALHELRQILQVLRSDTGGAEPAEPPQPTLDDLPSLVDDARRNDAIVETVTTGLASSLDQLPKTTSRHAFRIVQECLTNAGKHAAGAPVTIELAGRAGDALVITVSNPAPTASAHAPPGAGLGLVGMAERVDVLGGRLEHGPAETGGYRVRAQLPWPQVQPEGHHA